MDQTPAAPPPAPQSTEQSQSQPQPQPPPQPHVGAQTPAQIQSQSQAPPPSPTSAITTTTTTTTTTNSSLSVPPSSTNSTQPTTTSLSPPLPPSSNPIPTTKPSTPTPNPHSSESHHPIPSPTVAPFSRPWHPPQPAPFTHFSLPPSPTPPLPTSSSPSLSASVPPHVQRGGMAIGVPAHHPAPPPPASFSSINPPSFGQQFGGLGRNVPDTTPSSSTAQARPPTQGIQGTGMMGSLGSSSVMRPAAVPGNQLRPVQTSSRPQSSSSPQSPTAQNFQGHGMLRAQSVGSHASSSTNTAPSLQPQNQPWLSSGAQGRPPLPPQSLRPQMNSQSLQQRSHIPQQQQQHTMPMTTPQQQASSQQAQQSSTSSQPQDQFGQQYPPPRIQPSLTHQQPRGQGLGIQRPSSLAVMQSGAINPGPQNRTFVEDSGEDCNRILSKRTIQEILTQIDPAEKLDPEVEDILVDIAEEFVDSITTFGCSLAKHRKSNILEAKDILLHLERNWNITLPGFGGDEIKTYKKPVTNDLHRERLAAIKKSMVAGESSNAKSLAGQAGGITKSHLAKGPANILGSPNPKIREAT